MLIIGFITPILMNTWLSNGKVFLMFAAGSFISFIYLFLKMKETKGLGEKELKELYRQKTVK